MPSQQSVSAVNQSPIRTAIAASAAKQGSKFAPHLATVERQPGIRPADQKNMSPGPFRFDEQTWLRLVQTYGSQEGLGLAAEQITTGENGARMVRNPDREAGILSLREDPAIAQAMASRLALEQAPALASVLGRVPTDGELYLSHLLGPDRAARLVATRAANPAASATDLFPEAARRLPSVFGSKGAPKSVDQVMRTIEPHSDTRAAIGRKARFTDFVGQALSTSVTAGPVFRTGG